MTTHRTQWRLIVLLLVAGLFAAAQFGKLTLSFVQLQDAYGVWAAPMISIVGVVGILFGVVVGPLVASYGLARALRGAMLLGGVISVIEALLPTVPAMFGLRVIEGFSHLAMVVACPTLMAAASSDHDRPVVMGIWAAFFGISLALTALILPGLLALGGLPAVFLAHGIGMWVVAALLWRVLPEDPQNRPQRPSFIAAHKRVYSSPRLIIAGGGFVFYTILYIALLAVLPPLLDLPIWAVAAPPIVSLFGTFAAGFMARRSAPVAIALSGFALTIFSMIGLTAVAPIEGPVGFLWLALLFATMGVIPGASFAMIPHFNDSSEDRARATGGIAQLGNVGTTLGTPIFVAASGVAGLAGVTVTVVVFSVLGITVLALLGRRIK